MRPLQLVSGFIEDAFRSREEQMPENLLLRQLLVVASRKVKLPQVSSSGEGRVPALDQEAASLARGDCGCKPHTVLRWHREGFPLLWSRTSKAGRVTKPGLPQETIDLIARMSEENRLWGAERIRRELLEGGVGDG